MESTGEKSIDITSMESMPTEILQKILGYLPVHDRVLVERVCKKWKNVSTERVWRDVQILYIMAPELKTRYHRFRESLKKFGKFITMENNELFIGANELGIMKSLVSRAGQNVKKIIIAVESDKAPTKSVLSIITAHCHNIECIELDKVEKSAVRVFSKLLTVNKKLRSIKYTDADNIIEKLPVRDWKSLDLGSDGEKDEEDWNNRLVALVENSPSLEELCIPHWTPNIIAAIRGCKQLKSLDFLNWLLYDKVMNTALLNRLTCLKLTFFCFEFDSGIDLLRSCINLERLCLYPGFGQLPLEVVQAVLALPKLESLELSTCLITDEILSRFLKLKCLKLSSIQTFFNDSITENGIFEMIWNSECLEKLDISKMYVTTELFEKLAQNKEERRKVLKIEVSSRIYEEAVNICKGSKIHIIEMKL